MSNSDNAVIERNVPWYVDPVVYQIYPRSFADSNGDGNGDLRGIIEHLGYIRDLGVDAIWMSPCFLSPQKDGGYDVADYRKIDSMYGTNADMDELIQRAHELQLRVIIDLVPNHTSDQHEWFQEALAAGPNSPARMRYWFRDASAEPPNNWKSIFGGAAWTRVCDRADARGSLWQDDKQWYLHLFDPSQPDLNWEHADVRAEFKSVLRYWLDHGVDGFRIDVANGLVKHPDLPDYFEQTGMAEAVDSNVDPRFDQDGVHEIFQSWRAVVDSYETDAALIGELWVSDPDRRNPYIGDNELHHAFAFDLLLCPWDASALREVINAHTCGVIPKSLRQRSAWVMSNHDSVRHASRFGLNPPNSRPNGIGVNDPQPDSVQGLRLAKAATMLMLALPGAAYLYQGEELGLPEHTNLNDCERRDPTFVRSQGKELGRDGCRIPMPWTNNGATMGFSKGTAWLSQPESYRALAIDVQERDSASTLNFYRELLRLRRSFRLGAGELIWLDSSPGVLAFDIKSSQSVVRVMVNISGDSQHIPAGYKVIAASETVSNTLPCGAAIWLIR